MTGLLSAATRLALAKFGYRDENGRLCGEVEILESFIGATVSNRQDLIRAFADRQIDYVILDGPRYQLIRTAAGCGPNTKPWFVDRISLKDLDGVLQAGARRVIFVPTDPQILDRADRRVRARWRNNSDQIPVAFGLNG